MAGAAYLGLSNPGKFLVDFPEYKDYLPATTVKPGLPAIIPATVRAELSNLGIPAK